MTPPGTLDPKPPWPNPIPPLMPPAQWNRRVELIQHYRFTEKAVAILADNASFLQIAAEDAGKINPNWKLWIGQSYYTAKKEGHRWKIDLVYSVDDDKAEGNGRLWLVDHFVYDAKVGALEDFKRQWSVTPRVEEKYRAELEEAVVKLNQWPHPLVTEAAPFIDPVFLELIRPVLAGSDKPSLDSTEAELSISKFPSPWDRYRKVPKPEAPPEENAGLRGSELLEKLRAEAGRKKADADKGWFNESLPFLAYQPHAANLPALEKQVEAIAANPDPELRAHELVRFARDLLLKHDLPETAYEIAKHFQHHPGNTGREALDLLHLTLGRSGAGTKVEYLLGRFHDDLFNPALVLPMIAAPFAGMAAESYALSLFRNGRALAKSNAFLEFALPSVMSVAAEGGTFITLHHGLHSAVQDPDKVWKNYSGDVAGSFLAFGMMRMFHGVSGMLKEMLADRRFNTWANQGEVGWRFGVSPLGRVSASTYFGAELNWKGQAIAKILDHGLGLGALTTANYLASRLHLHPPHPQGEAGNLFDSTLFYLHALIGFNVANRLADGRLFAELAEVRGRLKERKDPRAGSEGEIEVELPNGGLVAKTELWDGTMNAGDAVFKPVRKGAEIPPAPLMPRTPPPPPPRPIVDPVDIQDLLRKNQKLNEDLNRMHREAGMYEDRARRLESEKKELEIILKDHISETQNAQRERDQAKQDLREKEEEVEGLREQVAREMARAREAEQRLRDQEKGHDPKDPSKKN